MQHKFNITVIQTNLFTAFRMSEELHLKDFFFFLVCGVHLLDFKAELFVMELSL